MIAIEQRLVVLETSVSAGFKLPGGRVDRETDAACSAHYLTWMNTGLNTHVVRHIDTVGDTHYYACRSDAGFDGTDTQLPIPEWGPATLRKISLIDPFDVTPQQWQSNDELIPMRDRFVAAQQTQ